MKKVAIAIVTLSLAAGLAYASPCNSFSGPMALSASRQASDVAVACAQASAQKSVAGTQMSKSVWAHVAAIELLILETVLEAATKDCDEVAQNDPAVYRSKCILNIIRWEGLDVTSIRYYGEGVMQRSILDAQRIVREDRQGE